MVHKGLGIVYMKKVVVREGSCVQMDGAEYRPGAKGMHPASRPLQQQRSSWLLFSRDDPGQSLGPKSSGNHDWEEKPKKQERELLS